MSGGETKLVLLDGKEYPEQLQEDAQILVDCSGETFETIRTIIFEDDEFDSIVNNLDEMKTAITEQTSLTGSKVESLLNFLQWAILTTGRLDAIESQIEQDLKTLDLPSDRAEKLATDIDNQRNKTRQVLYENSRIDPAPRLVNTTWNIKKITSTSNVQGINNRQVVFEFTFSNNGNQESIVFQTDGEGLQSMFTSIHNLQDELTEGVQDLE